MKKTIIILVLIGYIILSWLLIRPLSAKESLNETKEVQTIVYVEKPHLSSAQIIWLARLMDCESGINANAINPIDLDGTASLGILQFKTGTFNTWAQKYKIEEELMSPEAQVSIVTQWILNPGTVDWTNEFPGCVAKLGLPPII